MAEDRSSGPGGRGVPGTNSPERTDAGVGGAKVPSRERTTLGVAPLQKPTSPDAAPILMVKPTRERTVLGIGMSAKPFASPPAREISAQEPPPEGWDLPPEAELSRPPVRDPSVAMRDPSIAIDLSELEARTRAPAPRLALSVEASESSLVPAGVPRHRGVKWLAVLLLLAIAALGYVRREKVVPMLKRWQASIGATVGISKD